ncbi:MAG: hypothetical protein ABH896_02155 [Candidatus Jacksonbacteria bacterium]
MSKLKILIEYLFNAKPFSFASLGVFLLASALGAILLYILIKIFFNKIPLLFRKTCKKAQNILGWYGAVSIVLYFLRIQRVPYLSMRIWLWLWVTSILIWAILAISAELKKIPKRRIKINQEIKNRQYFNN